MKKEIAFWVCAKQFYLKHSSYLNPDSSDCRYSPSPLAWLPATRRCYVCFPHVPLYLSPRWQLSASPTAWLATCHLPSSWLPTSHHPSRSHSSSSHTPAQTRLQGVSGQRQPLGNQMAVAAINPFTRFPTHYHIATAGPLASSGVTTGTPCTLNPAQVSSPEVMRCWRGLTQGHSRLSSNEAMAKEAKHLKKYTVTWAEASQALGKKVSDMPWLLSCRRPDQIGAFTFGSCSASDSPEQEQPLQKCLLAEQAHLCSQ